MRILVTGASGSGTTTLGRALAARTGWRHLDLDDYFWLPTSPPFTTRREPGERLRMLSQDLLEDSDAIASGSLTGWGAEVEDAFGLIVFLYVPAAIRLQRLEARETQRYGKADPAFLEWAAQYDQGPPEGRSLAKHESWLAGRACPVLRIEGDTSVEERLEWVQKAIARDQ